MVKTKNIKIFLDPVGVTLNVWWDDPNKAHISEESASEELEVIVKDERGRIIGFRNNRFFPARSRSAQKFSETSGDDLFDRTLIH